MQTTQPRLSPTIRLHTRSLIALAPLLVLSCTLCAGQWTVGDPIGAPLAAISVSMPPTVVEVNAPVVITVTGRGTCCDHDLYDDGEESYSVTEDLTFSWSGATGTSTDGGKTFTLDTSTTGVKSFSLTISDEGTHYDDTDLVYDFTVVVATLSIGAPGGNYVGCDLDHATINLVAITSPATLPNTTFAWSVQHPSGNTYVGDGTFSPADQASTQFRGATRGKLMAHVSATTTGQTWYGWQTSSAISAQTEVVVVRVGVIDGSWIPYQQMDVYENNAGSFSVQYNSNSSGDLTSVLVAPPYDPSSYTWGTDFYGSVDHQDGSVDFTFLRDGEYVLKITRVDSSGSTNDEYKLVAYNSSSGSVVPEYTATGKVATPSADLVMISSAAGADDNGYLVNARSSISGDVPIDSVADASTQISAYKNMHGGNFTVAIIDHGRPGSAGAGCGLIQANGKFLSLDTVPDRLLFAIVCTSSSVTQVKFIACEVAKGQQGIQFLQAIADDIHSISTGFDRKIWCRKNGEWSVERNTTYFKATQSAIDAITNALYFFQ